MVICKFFLQGTCRFGENCKFEHQLPPSDHNYTGTSVLLQQQQNYKPTQTTNIDINTLVKSVVNDMTQAEKGGQWLLSSYAPFKEKAAFPGFEDTSMEEVRLKFYEAVKNGTVEQFKQSLQVMLQNAVMKIKALQNPSPDVVNILKNIYNNTANSNVVNNNNSTSFGQQQQQQQQQRNSVFGTPNSSFTAPGNQNNFGSNSIFGNPAPNQSIFGSKTPTTSNSIFGKPSVFSQQNSAFNATQNTPNRSIFGAAPSTQSNSIFGGQNTSIFSQTSSGNTNSFFGSNNNTSKTIFGGTPVFSAPATTSSNVSPIFGSQGSHSNSVFGGAQNFAQLNQQTTSTTSPSNNNGNNTVFGAAPVFGSTNNNNNSGNNSIFGAAPRPSIFGNSPPQQQQQQIFNTQQDNSNFSMQNNSFGTPQVTATANFGTSPFNASQITTQNSLFNQPKLTTTTQSQNTPQQYSASIFGNLAPNTVSSSAKPCPEYYSKLEELTEDMLKWFNSDNLDLASIPEEPPAAELCF